jgi:hypothetical protein
VKIDRIIDKRKSATTFVCTRTPLAGAGGKVVARVSKLWALAGCELAFATGVGETWRCSHIIDFQVNHEFWRIIKI